MSDCTLSWGGDIVFGPDGDLSLVSGPDLTSQRVLRRLLTNNGGYIWHQSYGGGLANFVGNPYGRGIILATVRDQMSREAAVMQTPRPEIDLLAEPTNCINELVLNIQYTDASSGNLAAVDVSIGK